MGSIQIKEIRHRSDATVVVDVTVCGEGQSERVTFAFLSELYDVSALRIGEIPSDVLCDLEFWANVTNAFNSACRSIAFSQGSYMALNTKLLAKGFSKNVCEQAIELVKRRGYVNESEIAQRRAEMLVEKLWGQTRIVNKLYEEGFRDEALEGVYLYLEGVDMVDRCVSLIEKRYGEVPKERSGRDKLSAALYRYGYSPSEIRLAFSRMSGN